MAVMFLLLMLMDEDARVCVLLPPVRAVVVGRGGLCVTFVVTFEFYSRV